jgi:hypothetical protein
MTGKVIRRRLAVMAVLAISLAVPLASGIAGGGKKKSKGLDPLADGSDKSSHAKLLEDNPGLEKALMKNDTFKRLLDGLPKVTLKPRLRKGKEGTPAASGTFFVAEGDLTLDKAQLLFFARDFAAREQAYKKRQELEKLGLPRTSPGGHQTPVSPLVGAIDAFGNLLHWTPGSTVNYCVQLRTFDSDDEYQAMVTMMAAATANWQKTCNIKFKHVDALDDTDPGQTPPQAGAGGEGVTFTVRRAADDIPTPNGGKVVASSFFPGDGPTKRHLWLYPIYYAAGQGFDQTGVLRHELGHVIGFRHEFARADFPPNACGLQEQPAGEPVTPIDFQSVMAYPCPQAGIQTSNPTMQITILDGQGARMVYGAPQQ